MTLLKSVTTLDKCLLFILLYAVLQQSRNNEHAHLYEATTSSPYCSRQSTHRHSATAITADKTDTQRRQLRTIK